METISRNVYHFGNKEYFFMPWADVRLTLITGCIMGLVSAYLAHRQGRNLAFWFFIGLLFGVFGLLFFFNVPEKKKLPPITKPEPQPYVFGPSDKFWYFLDETQTQIGPMSYTALANHWKQGKIKPATFVWHEELSDWKPLQELIRVREVPHRG
jgi:hypothetical protein